jgi:hypothetical protein
LITSRWRDKIPLLEFEWLAFREGPMRRVTSQHSDGRFKLELVSGKKEGMKNGYKEINQRREENY